MGTRFDEMGRRAGVDFEDLGHRGKLREKLPMVSVGMAIINPKLFAPFRSGTHINRGRVNMEIFEKAVDLDHGLSISAIECDEDGVKLAATEVLDLDGCDHGQQSDHEQTEGKSGRGISGAHDHPNCRDHPDRGGGGDSGNASGTAQDGARA